MHGAHTCDGSKSPLAWIIIGKHIKTLDKKPVKVTWKIFRNVAAENVANCTKDLCSLPCQTCHWPCRQSTRCRGAARPASPPHTWPKLIILQLIIFYSLCFSRQLGGPKKLNENVIFHITISHHPLHTHMPIFCESERNPCWRTWALTIGTICTIWNICTICRAATNILVRIVPTGGELPNNPIIGNDDASSKPQKCKSTSRFYCQWFDI